MGGDAGGLLKFPAVISNVDASPFYYKCYRFFPIVGAIGSRRNWQKMREHEEGREAPEPLPGGGRRRGTVPGCPPPAPPAVRTFGAWS